ncbi:saccharopine dehydrogenase NADP-binding domain-containing protein [Salicibibacter cibarius]|uniref:Saccharopine dehydrogenase NADP-binding domain-containing protein n=1 Tax=Salicibibacter cibarius TaxID=2743000 RepID=A0A7T6Z633_9BACI|nr:saccharopine dehydrogenase C-terminal domain-containing protein [Salicibibacter cibarius]QQK77497.1 saccharopine dehydrogenase NADP-binding domain-containing protein [Salicibibacter cibarius]
MKIAILGAGLMGKEAARDLVNSSGVEKVALADIDLNRAEFICKQLNAPALKGYRVDASDPTELSAFIADYDVVINALFYSFNETVAAVAIEAGVHCVDLGGHIGNVTDQVLKKDNDAKRKGVTIIPDLGVAPGMINILSGHGIGKLDRAQSVKLYVGGIPMRPESPLEYNHVFSMEGLLDHYTDPASIIRNGSKDCIPSLSEIEKIYFDRFGPLEAFHTSGGTSTLSRSFPNLNTLEYKTIRYPGHAEKFKLLVDLNLTDKNYSVDVNGQRINPREVLLKTLEPIVDLKDKDDAVLLRVIVEGIREGKSSAYTYEMITMKDREHDVTAMARATANTISVVAQMIGSGDIHKRGVCPPEQIVPGDSYIKAMGERNVIITESVTED